MADHHGHVHRGRRTPPFGKVLADRPRRTAVGTEHDRRDPLRHLRFRSRIRGELARGMIVDVDEPWCEDAALAVDRRVAAGRSAAIDARNPSVRDVNVHGAKRTAGAVGDLRAHDRETRSGTGDTSRTGTCPQRADGQCRGENRYCAALHGAPDSVDNRISGLRPRRSTRCRVPCGTTLIEPAAIGVASPPYRIAPSPAITYSTSSASACA